MLKSIEKSLEGVFKGAPDLPKGAKDWLVSAWPWLALIFGVLQILLAIGLFGVFSVADTALETSATYYRIYAGETVTTLSSVDKLVVYLGIAMLAVDAVILLMAYPHLVKRARRGWDLLFLAMIINAGYAVVSLFVSGNNFGDFISSILGSAIGLYLLFQIKSAYTAKAE